MSRPRRSTTPAGRALAKTSGSAGRARQKGDVFTRSFAERIGREPRLDLLTAAERRVLAELLGVRWRADSDSDSGSDGAPAGIASADPAAHPRRDRRGRGRGGAGT